MKTVVGNIVASMLVVLAMGACAAQAQITNQLDFKVSQAFTVGDTTLAAGSYQIRPISGTDELVIEISSVSGKPSVMVSPNLIQPDPAQAATHLVFNRYKNVLALSQVFPGNGNQGYQLAQGNSEKMAAKSEKPTQQTVASTGK